MQAFSPREIVSELDRYIIGQDEAKKSVAIALRNRWRRAGDVGEAVRAARAVGARRGGLGPPLWDRVAGPDRLACPRALVRREPRRESVR